MRTQSTPRKWTRGGFTLLELLVVIGVIAILASLLLPTLSRAKAASHAARCRSNVRQLAIALTLYADDNQAYPLDNGRDGRAWMDSIIPYTNGIVSVNGTPTSQFLCPSAGFMLEGWLHPSFYGYNVMGTVNGYTESDVRAGRFGLGLGGYSMDGVGEVAVPSSAVRVPHDMIAFGDGFIGMRDKSISYGPAVGANWIGFLRPEEAKAYRAAAQKRHDGRLIMAFCDGHVEAIKVQALLLDQSDAALRRWNNDHEPHRSSSFNLP